MNKVRTLNDLKAILESRKESRVVFANGCFDVLHVGHVRYLQEARALGDLLIVGLNSDDSVHRLKGEGRPVLNQDARAELLGAMQCVDYVVIFDDDTVDRLLVELRPHFHCKGGDYTPETVPEKETVKRYGGSTSITGGRKIQSTRWLFEEIRRRYS
ncbi:adenylyltransferase/cytidyltransferase family protein [bacterium]|nr:adenylyltransferase/cytidyltransferase family protein [bacterium]MCI0603550.1 adenylyltransferase/cytidyltransferase family protein [bacterium]